MIKRFRIVVEGRVQGVGFRSFCQYQASIRNLTGIATNLDNGMVEIYVQGESELIDEFLGVIIKGDRFIRVDDYIIKEIDVKTNEKRFTIGWGSYY